MNYRIKLGTMMAVLFAMVVKVNAQTIESAALLKRNEQFEKASSEYGKLISFGNAAMGRQEPEAAMKLSTIYYQTGDNYMKWALSESENASLVLEKMDSAMMMFEKGARIMDGNPMNHIGVAGVLGWKKDVVGMDNKLTYANTQALDKKLKLTKELTQEALLGVASTYSSYGRKEDLAKANLALNEVLKRNPKNRDLFVVWGDYEDAARKYASGIEASNLSKAIEQYNKAMTIDPLNVIAVLKKGVLYKQVENWDKALEFYNEAIKIEPNFAPAYREKAELLKSAQRFSQAVEAYDSYLKLNNSCSASQRYSTFLFLAKDYAKAMMELERTLPCNPNNAVMYRVLAYTCLETGDYAKGLQNIDAFFTKVQDTKYITGADYAVKGKLLNALGQDSLGIAMIAKGMEVDTAYKSGYDEIIELYKKAKKFDKVAMWTEKKIKRLGGKPLDYFNWAQNIYLSKNYMRADSVFATVEEQYFEATLMRAKANNRMETADDFKGLGKPHFEKYITRIAEAEVNIPGTIEKSKKGLAEAYDYLGVFYARNNDDVCAKAAWSIVLTLDSAHKRANEMLAEKEMQAADGTLCSILPSLTAKKKEDVAPNEGPKE